MANDYSKNLSSDLNEDKIMKIKPKSTENFFLCSDGEVSTTVDINLTDSAGKGKHFFCLFNKINLEVRKVLMSLIKAIEGVNHFFTS